MTISAIVPDISFADRTPDEIIADIIAGYEEAAGRILAPADPVRIFLNTVAAREIALRFLVDLRAQMNLISYATGEYLDSLGELLNVERLAASAAITTIEFTLSAAQPSVVTIPAGTRVSTGALIFATVENVEIAIGATTASVTAACTTIGSAGNGYLSGQIAQMVDILPYVSSAANTTTSQGGADTESDAAYRDRIRIAPTSFSCAGPANAYIYWAKTANQSIIDVSVTTPNAGEVLIVPLLTGGEIPDETILDAVLDVVSADTVRPLTDLVTVEAPTEVSYDVTMSYWIDSANTAQSVTIQAAVEAAVAEYVLWQKSKLGRDINPSELIYRVMAAGAKRVTVSDPVYTSVDGVSVALGTEPDITYEGLEVN